MKYLLNKKYVLLLEQQNEHLGYNGFLMIEWVCLFTGKNMEKGNYFEKTKHESSTIWSRGLKSYSLRFFEETKK